MAKKAEARKWAAPEMKVMCTHWSPTIVKHKERGHAIHNTLKLETSCTAEEVKNLLVSLGIEPDRADFMPKLPEEIDLIKLPTHIKYAKHQAIFSHGVNKVVQLDNTAFDNFVAIRITETVYKLEFKCKASCDNVDDQPFVESIALDGEDDKYIMLAVNPPAQADLDLGDDEHEEEQEED
jgi:hypothetical protein